jgi:heterotetrameric sarcosine oxidase gamma subunit
VAVGLASVPRPRCALALRSTILRWRPGDPGVPHAFFAANVVIRYEPTVWLVEGDVSALPGLLVDDGALTAIGGSIVRVQLSGKGWRTLLMEGGVFDAENPNFASGCSAATIIDHVNVRLHVVDDDTCHAYVPLSYSEAMIHFWKTAALNLTL